MTLRAAREAKGWDQLALAERSGVHQSTISRLEDGKQPNPSYNTIVALERALGLERGTLVFGADALEAAS